MDKVVVVRFARGEGLPITFDNSIVSRIQQATDIVEVVSEHLSLQKKGKEMVGLCPFHTDHRPSMYVNPAKQIFKCFACGAGGDVFKFIQLRENLTFPQAVERLAQRCGIKLESSKRTHRKTDGSEGQVPQADPKMLAKVNDWAKKLWQSNLHDTDIGSGVRSYIENRQINAQSVKDWSLGFATDSWDCLLEKAKSSRISDNLLLAAGLIVAKEGGKFYDKFRNRLMFPIFDVTGRVIGFGGRTLGDDPAKYMNSPATVLFDKSNAVYGLDKARHQIVSSGTAVVVEGYTDVIMAHQFGCNNVVATLGTSFTSGHARLLRRYAKRIVLVFDSDIAGIEAANRALEVCLAEKIDIKLAFAGDGRDPCDFLLAEGADAFEQLVSNAVDVMEFKWKRLIDGLETSDNLSDRRAIVQEYLTVVATAIKAGSIDPIAQGLIVSKLSGIIGLSIEQINRQLTRLAGRLGTGQAYTVKNQKVVSIDLGQGFMAGAQREILEVLLNESKFFQDVNAQISVEQFDVPVLREIAEVLFELLQEGHAPTLAQIMTRIESPQTASAVLELVHTGKEKGNYCQRIEKAVDVLKTHQEEIINVQIKAGLSDEDSESLWKITEKLGKGNKRNPGMIIN